MDPSSAQSTLAAGKFLVNRVREATNSSVCWGYGTVGRREDDQIEDLRFARDARVPPIKRQRPPVPQRERPHFVERQDLRCRCHEREIVW
jgi:hypothetical protein